MSIRDAVSAPSTSLYESCSQTPTERLKSLLSEYVTAQKINFQEVAILLQQGADPQVKIKIEIGPGRVMEEPALVMAVNHNNVQLVQWLVFRLNFTQSDAIAAGEQALANAAYAHNLDIFRILLKACRGLAQGKNPQGQSPMHEAITSEFNQGGAGAATCQTMIEELLKAGCDINIKNSQEYTPLHYAVMQNLPGIVKFLVERGANVHAKAKDGKTPFDETKNSLLISLLQQSKLYQPKEEDSEEEEAIVKTKDSQDPTAQQLQAMFSRYETTSEINLTEVGKLLNKDNASLSFLAVAAHKGHRDLVELLIPHVVKPQEHVAETVAEISDSDCWAYVEGALLVVGLLLSAFVALWCLLGVCAMA